MAIVTGRIVENNLWDKIDPAPYFKSTPIFKECVDKFSTMLDRQGFSGCSELDISINKLIRYGLPLTFFSDEQLDIQYISRLVDQLKKCGEINEKDFAEIQALSILMALKFNSFEIIQQGNNKSNDFNAIVDDESIEVEVTQSDAKNEHEKRQAQTERLSKELFEVKSNCDFFVYASDILSESEISQIVLSSRKLEFGGNVGVDGSWHIFAEEPNGAPGIVLSVDNSDPKPKWWPKHTICSYSISTSLAGPDATVPTPRCVVRHLLPVKGYLNSAMKKARRFQGSREKPYLLVLDANYLTGAIREFEKIIDPMFKKWTHVSCILVFEDYWGGAQVGWTLAIFPNKYAKRPISERVLKNFPLTNKEFRILK